MHGKSGDCAEKWLGWPFEPRSSSSQAQSQQKSSWLTWLPTCSATHHPENIKVECGSSCCQGKQMCLKSRCSWSLRTLSGYVLPSIVKVWTLKSRIKSAIIMLHSDVHPNNSFPPGVDWCVWPVYAGVVLWRINQKCQMMLDGSWSSRSKRHQIDYCEDDTPICQSEECQGPMVLDNSRPCFLMGPTHFHFWSVKQHGPRVKSLLYIIWMVYWTIIPGQIKKMRGRSWHTGAIMIFQLRFLWGSFPVEWPWFIDFNRGAASASVAWNIDVLHDKLYQIVINCPSGPPAAIKRSTIANFKCWYFLQINDQTAVSTKNAIRLPCSKMSQLDPIHDVKLPWHCPCKPNTVPRVETYTIHSGDSQCIHKLLGGCNPI